MSFDQQELQNTHERARTRLLEQFTETGSCKGELSSSALSTATAAMAFALSQRAAESRNKNGEAHGQLTADGHRWLCNNQNQDGGWGDTTDSPSNISTTTLCWASLSLAEDQPTARSSLDRAEAWLKKACGDLSPELLSQTIKGRYGKDQTFSAPILMTCALADKLGDEGWRFVPSLPFELAACPHQIFPLLQLRMVSYALPALIALGQVRHFHLPSKSPISRVARRVTRRRTLRILQAIQPTSGGYLEAAPLTSFVAMAMISMEQDEHAVTQNCLRFLAATVRPDGCWPIDTNLDTWTTTLAVNALAPDLEQVPQEKTRRWLLAQQYLTEHPYTHAAPGGWAWTDLPGGVPDADDTAGAILALRSLADADPHAERVSIMDSAAHGIRWLLGIQNMDGGMPTFCRGWGKLPFDRSSPDLSAHAIRAFDAWRGQVPGDLLAKVLKGRDRLAAYLLETQGHDGSWVPLWFGNQHEEREENPLYGTSRVLLAVAEVRLDGEQDSAWYFGGKMALRWLLNAQRSDGGFGAGPGVRASIEETGLGLEALAAWYLAVEEKRLPVPEDRTGKDRDQLRAAIEGAAGWLVAQTEEGRDFPAAPVGLYFAKLWYSERLYPLVFAVAGMGKARAALGMGAEYSGAAGS